MAPLTKLKDRDSRLAYAAAALEHGWSRAVLTQHIEARTVERQGRALTGDPCRSEPSGTRVERRGAFSEAGARS